MLAGTARIILKCDVCSITENESTIFFEEMEKIYLCYGHELMYIYNPRRFEEEYPLDF